jgi:hypothetical protein
LQGREDRLNTLGDLVHIAHAVNLVQEATVTVESRKRGRLVVVDRQPVPDDNLSVIGAAIDLGALEETLDNLICVYGQLKYCV